MFWYSVKKCICAAVAVVFSLLLAVGIRAVNVSKFSAIEGERTFFLDSASSQALIKTELALSDLGRVKGECVSFSIHTYEGGRYALSEEIAVEIAARYGAEIQCIEECAGVTSYYAYTARWQEYMLVDGKPVNLHIAVSKEECVVGTPIIFGGF